METEQALGLRRRKRARTPEPPSAGPSTPASQASQSQDEEEDPPDELLIAFRSEVVGIQHYPGLVGAGEVVMLRRQPANPYDSNAVQVLNATGEQVGHVPRATAARIAPLMDARLVTVEGRMIGQNLDRKHRFKLPMDMCIYCRSAYRSRLEAEFEWATPMGQSFDMLRRKGQDPNESAFYDYAPPGSQAGASGSSSSQGGGVGELLKVLKQENADEKAADDVMAALTADMDVTKLPLHPDPPSLENEELTTDLLPHQSQALAWMVAHEHPKLPGVGEPAVQFWSRQKNKSGEYWLNAATRTPQEAEPELGRGGIIADGMGLGKTLSTLALVLATMDEAPGEFYSDTTLIGELVYAFELTPVCPLSVLSNWQKQAAEHVAPGKLAVYTYHGAGAKGVKGSKLVEYDVVLTTYQTLQAEAALDSPAPKGTKAPKAKGKKGPLMKVHWKRVVADEGHVLKNPKAKMTRAFCALQAERRWIATGTPIVNSPQDLGTLLAATRLCAPLDQAAYFKSLVLRPLRSGSQEAGRLLQGIVGQVLLRRTKDTLDAQGERIVQLPPIEYYTCEVALDPETRATYDAVLELSKQRFEESMRSGEAGANVLSMLTRMRQLCLSADLVPANYLEELSRPPTKGPAVKAVKLSAEERARLLARLRQAVADQEECAVCFDILSDPRITDCGHPFCFLCITEVIRRQALCPMDRHALSPASLLELPPDADLVPDETSVRPPTRSAKIDELVKYLRAFEASDKTLVFSQFTSFLDRVAAVLSEEGISYCRFDGSMPAKKRKEVIAAFQNQGPDTPRVMLISLKSGAVGLNLTAASNVFLCDPWWQSAIEAQAVDRVHRMGQAKTVRVFQLIAADTVEAKVLDIQKRKDALVAKAFEKSGTRSGAADKKRARFEDLKEIFGLGS